MRAFISIKPLLRTGEAARIIDNRIQELTSIIGNPAAVIKASLDSSEKSAKNLIKGSLREKLSNFKINDTIRSQTIGNEKPINLLVKAENKLIGNLDIPSIDSLTKRNILEIDILQSQQVGGGVKSLGAPQTLWCKEGYYVEFNNTLRIGINDLNVSDQSIDVNFKDVEDEKEIPINNTNTFCKLPHK